MDSIPAQAEDPAAPDDLAGADVFDPADTSWTPVSPRLARMRRSVIGVVTLVLLVVDGVLTLVLPLWIVAVAALAVLLAAAWLGVVAGRNARSWGYTERADDLLVRRGILWRQLVVVPYGRMQFVDVNRGPVQRWFGLATVQLHTAAAASDARIPGLEPAEAARLRDRLAARGEARSAGL